MNTLPDRPFSWKIPTIIDVVLAGLGLLMVLSFLYAVWANVASNAAVKGIALIQALLFLGSAWIVLTRRVSGFMFSLIIVVAILCRRQLVVTPPRFSSDVYRYVWDGRVQAAGINPYRYIPADPTLAYLRDAVIYPRMNRVTYAHTIYPPGAQAIFLATTRVSESVTGMKAAIVGFETVTVWIMSRLLSAFGLRRERVLLYVWNPLVIWQFAGDGHIDAAAIAVIAVTLLAHACRREIFTGVALGAAALVKFYPAILLPVLYRRGSWKMPVATAATIVAGYLPYLGAGAGTLGFLPGYAKEEGVLTGSGFFLLRLLRSAGAAVPTSAYIASAMIALLVIGFKGTWETERTGLDDVRRGLVMAAAFLLLSSPHYLWYFCWVVLFLCFAETVPILLYVASTCALVFATLGYGSVFGLSDEMLDFNISLYVPLAVLLVSTVWRSPSTRDAMHTWARFLWIGGGRTERVDRPDPAGEEA